MRALFAPAAVALLTALVQLPFFRLWFNFMDEGHMVQFADIAAQGGEFYRDATFYPLPGAFWLLALAFKTFGASIEVSRWLVMLEFAVFVALVFALIRRMTDARYAIVAVGCMWLYRVWSFPHWQIYSYSTTSLLVLLAALMTLLLYLRGGDRRVLIASGFLYGLGVLCKQDYGAAALVTVVVVLVAYLGSVPRSERIGAPALLAGFFLPAAAVGGLTGLYYLQAGILGDLLQFTVLNHFVGMGTYEYMEFPNLMPVLGQDPAMRTKVSIMGYMPGIMFTADWANVRSHPLFTDTALYDVLTKAFFFGPQLFLAGAFVRLFVIRDQLLRPAAAQSRDRYLAELMLAAFAGSLVTLIWLNKPQDYLHLAVLYWPLICLALVHLHALLSGHRRRALVFAGVFAIPAALVIAYSGRLLYTLYDTHSDLIPGERAGIYAQPTEAQMMGDLVAYIRENSAPDDRVAAIPYFPIANFLAERMGPHRSAYIVWPFPEIPDRDERIIEAMEEAGTDLVIYNFTQFYSFNPVWEHAPELFAYLVDRFTIDRVFTYDAWGYKLVGLRRDPDPAPRGTRVIPEGAVGAALFVEEEGPPRPVPPEARSTYVQEMLWPFRPVVALRASTGGRRTVLRVPVEVPEGGAELRSAVAVHPQWWFKLPPSWVEFSLIASTDAGREVLYERQLNPTVVLEDRAWFPVEVSLDRFAGQTIDLEFVNRAERPRGETVWMGGWEIPRLVPRAVP